MKKLTTKKLTDSAAAIIANSKSTLSTQEQPPGGYSKFVLDMLHLKTPDVKVTGPGKAVGPDYIDRTSARSLQKALSAASKASPITSLVVTHPLGKTGKGGIRIPYAVTVTKETDPGATEHYATFTLKIEPLTIPSCKTVIKVIFSRDVAEGASKYQIAVQANPTSLLTGQNTWPMQPITTSLRGDLAVQFAAPFVVIIAVCQHANPNFQPSPDLASTFLRGRYMEILQNSSDFLHHFRHAFDLQKFERRSEW